MANVKFTELPQTLSATTNSILAIVQSDTSYHIKLEDLGKGIFPIFGDTEPPTCYGTIGDKEGTVFFTTAFFYFCFADYTIGGIQIWERIATDATAW
tara:strand:+ start:655 stop:945 length:291 start_codon:yes stop_codon:yes gene_type:complete